MEQWEPPMAGTLRISNPKTLERWIHNGNFQKEIDEGYKFYVGCGRFRTEPCTCHKCRKGQGKKLQEVIDRHYSLIVNGFEIKQSRNVDGKHLPSDFLQWEGKHLFTGQQIAGKTKKECIKMAESYY